MTVVVIRSCLRDRSTWCGEKVRYTGNLGDRIRGSFFLPEDISKCFSVGDGSSFAGLRTAGSPDQAAFPDIHPVDVPCIRGNFSWPHHGYGHPKSFAVCAALAAHGMATRPDAHGHGCVFMASNEGLRGGCHYGEIFSGRTAGGARETAGCPTKRASHRYG